MAKDYIWGIYTGDLRKIGGVVKAKKKKQITRKQRTIGRFTLGGLATGLGVGSVLGGLPIGLMAGVPLGTYAGNLLGKYRTRKKR